jgi:hypothetical protein
LYEKYTTFVAIGHRNWVSQEATTEKGDGSNKGDTLIAGIACGNYNDAEALKIKIGINSLLQRAGHPIVPGLPASTLPYWVWRPASTDISLTYRKLADDQRLADGGANAGPFAFYKPAGLPNTAWPATPNVAAGSSAVKANLQQKYVIVLSDFVGTVFTQSVAKMMSTYDPNNRPDCKYWNVKFKFQVGGGNPITKANFLTDVFGPANYKWNTTFDLGGRLSVDVDASVADEINFHFRPSYSKLNDDETPAAQYLPSDIIVRPFQFPWAR